MKVVLCIPTLTRPYQECLDAIEASVPLLDAAGIEHQMTVEQGCPYISHARATMLRRALDGGADAVVFIDHDLSWRPQDLVTLIQTDGDVVAGTYRFKKEPEEYMAVICCHANGKPIVRADGCMYADRVPAGFLKVTREAVRHFMRSYPALIYGNPEHPSVDLFNHGVINGVWYGEDYAFSLRWRQTGRDIVLVPDLTITHHGDKPYPGNFHEFMLRQPA